MESDFDGSAGPNLNVKLRKKIKKKIYIYAYIIFLSIHNKNERTSHNKVLFAPWTK